MAASVAFGFRRYLGTGKSLSFVRALVMATNNFEYELRVQHFLVENGVTFVSPQFELPYSKELDSGGSNPDFVAIRPATKEVYVVEVSVSGSLKNLAEKIKNREKQWLNALRNQLVANKVITSDWKEIEVLVFVRADKIEWFKTKVGLATNVHIWPVEYTLQHWLWPAEVRQPGFDFRNTALAVVCSNIQG
jgi:hypothetical protein